MDTLLILQSDNENDVEGEQVLASYRRTTHVYGNVTLASTLCTRSQTELYFVDSEWMDNGSFTSQWMVFRVVETPVSSDLQPGLCVVRARPATSPSAEDTHAAAPF